MSQNILATTLQKRTKIEQEAAAFFESLESKKNKTQFALAEFKQVYRDLLEQYVRGECTQDFILYVSSAMCA